MSERLRLREEEREEREELKEDEREERMMGSTEGSAGIKLLTVFMMRALCTGAGV